MTANQQQPRHLLRLPAVRAATGLGRTTIYELMARGTFPRSYQLTGTRAVVWDSAEIAAWINEQLEGRK